MKIARKAGSGALVVTAALALAAACTPADVGDAVDQACQDYAYAYCEKLQGCSATAIELRYGNVSTCSKWQKASCVAFSNAPSSTNTAAWQTSCTQNLGGWSCLDFLQTQNPPLACQAVAGPLENGMACAVRSQCQSLYCAVPFGQACGTCATAPPVGASCAVLPCAQGNTCVGTPPVCAIFAQTGGACGGAANVPCVSGLNCAGGNAITTGTCQPAAEKLDMPCVFTGAGCDVNAGLACNAATNACQTVRISPPGEACGIAGDQPASCEMGICVHGACVARPPLGGACELTGQTCLTPGHCVVADGGTSGTCQVLGSATCQ